MMIATPTLHQEAAICAHPADKRLLMNILNPRYNTYSHDVCMGDAWLIPLLLMSWSHLYDHCVHLLWAELELVPAETVTQTQTHGPQVSATQLTDQTRQLTTNTTSKLLDGGTVLTKTQTAAGSHAWIESHGQIAAGGMC